MWKPLIAKRSSSAANKLRAAQTSVTLAPRAEEASMAGRTGLPKSVLGLAAGARLAGRSRVLRVGCILHEPGAPRDEGIPRDEGLLGVHRARRRLLHDQVLERQGAQGGLEDLLRPGGG